MAMKKQSTEELGAKFIANKPHWNHTEVEIEGTSPLAMQARPMSVIENLSRKDNGLTPIKYKTSDWRRFIDSMHWININQKPQTLDNNKTDEELEAEFNALIKKYGETGEKLFYIPSEAFKETIIKGAFRNDIIGKMEGKILRGAFLVQGEKCPIDFEAVEMEKEPTINRAAKNAMVIGVYSKFYKWSTTLKINYNDDILSAQTLLDIMTVAGLSVGILARRTELSFGKYGTFRIKSATKPISIDL